MLRGLATALLCGAAIIAGDLLFRGSLLSAVRPIILSPREQAVLHPPVEIHWDGPERMRVLLTPVGDQPRDLGVQSSPFSIGREEFIRDGGYRLELEAPTFGNWIRADRLFQVYAEPPPDLAEQPEVEGAESRFFLEALDAVRRVRDRARGRAKQYRHENTVLRDETIRLANEIEELQSLQNEDSAHAEDLETRLIQLANDYRALSDENAALRQRLDSVNPCTVWGYYSYPRPNTIPATRQIVAVSDSQARVFRVQAECEAVRRDDPTASSTCFCVGNSWQR
jgi:hypothetical protein